MSVKNRAGQLAGGLLDEGFVEVQGTPCAKSEIDADDYAFEQRLVNWGRVVGSRRRAGGNVSSAWAADYIANRDNRDLQLALRLKMIEPLSLLAEIESQVFSQAAHVDGWLVESAWTLLLSLEHKQALRFKFVFGWGDALIRRKLRLRGNANVRLVLWRAKTSLKQVLDKSKNKAIIQPNNLIAGVPCLKSVPKGGLVTPEEVEALTD